MGLMDMPVFTALTDKMRWHQTRQGLLAENVANAETPGYRGRDLKQFDFAEQMRMPASTASVTTRATQPMHYSVSSQRIGRRMPASAWPISRSRRKAMASRSKTR